MTGRDLIIYILENGLENEPLVDNGKLIGFMSVMEAAAKLHVGPSTILIWMEQNKLEYVRIGFDIFITADSVQTLFDNK